ncbi:ABC transporter ATP-binding protein [Rathayibacter sp. CAU 1779]
MSTTAAPTAVRAEQRAAGGALPIVFDGVGRTFPPQRARRGDVVVAEPVLRDVTLEVAPGEVIAILGASGCGKSTLLRIAGGLDTPTAGSVRIGGTSVTRFDPRCAVGFQEPRLLPWRSLADNVALGLPRGSDRRTGRDHVARLLDLVGLTASAGLRPREVSGGMAQRASLARAFARNPGVLLLDEPFGALDALTRLKMQDLLLDVHNAEPTTVLLVTHDVDEALQLADRIVLLGRDSDGQGEDRPGASIRQLVTVPGSRPRDRGDADLAALRAELLAGLGVDRHERNDQRGSAGLAGATGRMR